MSEPEGLSMSLDDLIKKKTEGRQQGGGRSAGKGGQGGGSQQNKLGVHSGAVQKPQPRGQQRQFQQGGFNQQQQGGFNQQHQQQGGRGGRGGFAGQQGRGRFNQQHQQGGRGFGNHQQQQQGGFQQGYRQGQTRYNESYALLNQPPPPPRKQALPCRTFLRQETGEVVVQLKDTEVVTVSPAGEITLNTGGFYTVSTLNTINKALGSLGYGVRVVGPVENGAWQVSMGGAKLLRFYDGMVLAAMGAMSASRGTVVLAAMQNAVDGDAATFLSDAGSGAAGGMMGGGMGGMGGMAGMNPLAAAATAMSNAAAMSRANLLAGRGAAGGINPAAMASLFAANPAMLQAMQAMASAAGYGAGGFGAYGASAGAAQTSYEQEEPGGVEAMDTDTTRRLRAQGRY